MLPNLLPGWWLTRQTAAHALRWRPVTRKARCRFQHSSTTVVTNEYIRQIAAKTRHQLTLADLVKHGRPPICAPELLRSANFTLSLLPCRLAQRIQALQNLPYIVVTNPQIRTIYDKYVHTLSSLLPWTERRIDSLEQEAAFTSLMSNLVETHADTIPLLARGFLESSKYIMPADVTRFLDEHLRARIGTRLIAQQHIALHYSSAIYHQPTDQSAAEAQRLSDVVSRFIGVIDTKLSPASTIRHCESVVGDICEFQYGLRPVLSINGDSDYTFAHIPMHLEYILTELLKNAFRATIENRMEKVPIEVTIVPLPETCTTTNVHDQAASSASQDEQGPGHCLGSTVPASASRSTAGVTIRIRDRGGGIAPAIHSKIWQHSFTTYTDQQIQTALSPESGAAPADPLDGLNVISQHGGSSLAGLGYGLPLGRAYAEYFGGSLVVQSLWGWGTDVYLSLKGVGKIDGISQLFGRTCAS